MSLNSCSRLQETVDSITKGETEGVDLFIVGRINNDYLSKQNLSCVLRNEEKHLNML